MVEHPGGTPGFQRERSRVSAHPARGAWAPRSWRAFRFRAVLALALWLPLATPLGWAQPQAVAVSAREAFRAPFEPLIAARAELPRLRFDLDALALELAFEEPEDLIDAVQRAIRFEPYRGVLRGAAGTLDSGAGNAYDQALLLARLLASAGYDVEVWRAELTPAQSAELLRLVRLAPPPTPLSLPTLPLSEPVRAELEAGVATLRDAIDRDVSTFERLLADSLDAAEAATAMARVEAAAADYAFVAYRLGPSDRWREGHPVWGSAGHPWGELAVLERFDAEIPAELQHRLSFQVWVERRLGDTLRVEPVTDLWERPVANMYGTAITYTNFPDGLISEEPNRIDLELIESFPDRTSFFFPMFQEGIPSGSKAFDLMGNLLNPVDAANEAAKLFQTLAGNVSQAAGVLGALGSAAPGPIVADPLAVLTAQWLEIGLLSPGEAPQHHRRVVVDRILPEARAEGRIALDPRLDDEQVSRALASVHTFMVDTGRYSEAYVADVRLSLLAEQVAQAEAAIEALEQGGGVPAPSAELNALLERMAPLTLLQALGSVDLPEGVVSYRPAPAVAILSQPLGGAVAVVDVVANPRWSLRLGADGPRLDPAATLRAGLWETRAEVLALDPRSRPVVPAFAAFGAEPAPPRTLSGRGSEALLDPNEWPLRSRLAIAEDLERGYAVLLPSRSEGPTPGWWRVDPQTGETLGRGADGRGVTFTEYLAELELSSHLLTGGLILSATRTMASCAVSGSTVAYACCVLENAALTGVLAVVGAGIAGGFAVGALVLFVALDLSVGTAAMVAGTAFNATLICGGLSGVCRWVPFS